MRRGFSVFTPMVGTLVILITMLIVSSIITSERVAVQGSVKSYRSSELANIAANVQSVIISGTRDAINTNLENPTGDHPGLAITVNDCPAAFVSDKFYRGPREGLVCDDSGGDCGSADICWGNAIDQVNIIARGELVDKSLIESSVSNRIASVVGKYSLVNVSAKDVQFKDIIKGISFKTCSVGEGMGLGNCPDGRLVVDVDYTPLADTPLAEITSRGKRLQVFMPAEEREYTTRDPFMQYAALTATIFQNFQLLNNSWHNAGGTEDHNDPYYDTTNGSEWYLYNYAEQERYKDKNQNSIATDWAPGFTAEDPDGYFADGKDLGDYIADRIFSGGGTADDLQKLRFDNGITGSPLLDFVSGYATVLGDSYHPNFGWGTGAQKNTIFPAGCVSPASGGGCDQMGSPMNCLFDDAAVFGLPNSYSAVSYDWDPNPAGLTGTTLVNTTGDYDRKFDAMPDLVEQLADNARTPEIRGGMGIASAGGLNYKLVVTSYQYYLTEKGFGGKDNWHCGQFLTLYQTSVISGAPDICAATRNDYNGGDKGSTYCVAGDCSTSCYSEGEPCPWFISEPVNWTCDAKTLYRVDEKYRIFRSTPDNPEPTKPVFAGTFKREKVDYNTIGDDSPDRSLWNKNPRYNDILAGDDIGGSSQKFGGEGNNVPVEVRDCTYSYSTTDGALSKTCKLVSSDELPTL